MVSAVAVLDKSVLTIPLPTHVPVRNETLQGYQLDNAIVEHAVAWMPHRWTTYPMFVPVECKEHECTELVASMSYWGDSRYWYLAGKHPQYSLLKLLYELKQRYYEIHRGLLLRCADLLTSHTAWDDLRNALDPYLFVDLRLAGRRRRVTKLYYNKYQTSMFTQDDFFAERNQELRRHMLRRGISIPEICSRLRHVQTDIEGTIYMDEGTQRYYLYVKCPSTDQEYLLCVPKGGWPRNVYRNGDTFHDYTPTEARRWTFNLPLDAVFVQEA